MTNAERQAKHRRETVTVTLNDADWSELVNALTVALQSGVVELSDELSSAAQKLFRAGIKRPEAMPKEFVTVTKLKG
ncbi:hypothetical protein CXB49_09565 [Chromobacterium sp. ATCC 53434]|nr:hypothetical protein CXB49_09565 [Chromobacterium sp. ATCC 53434]